MGAPAGTGHDATVCEAIRWELSRLAAGVRQREHGLALARHVRDCPACDEWVDTLAALRRWLSGLAAPRPRPDRAAVEVRARRALVRELDARLARDLLALGQGRAPRAAAERRDDLLRLACLDGPATLERGPRAAAREALAKGARVPREQALRVAAQLDPLGLDVALAWLGQLVRAGQGERALVVAERLLAEVS